MNLDFKNRNNRRIGKKYDSRFSSVIIISAFLVIGAFLVYKYINSHKNSEDGQTYIEENNDIDGDGLSNELEIQIGTDPKQPDSDFDGLTDGEEYNESKTDPKNKDTDGDGHKDGEELDAGYNPLNDGQLDTDGDGLGDADEKNITTDPENKDTDRDGLTDGEEYNKWKTNPLKKDSDGDGIEDGEEVSLGSDPLFNPQANNNNDDIIEDDMGEEMEFGE